MLEIGKVHNVIQEMNRLSIQVMGVSECRWKDKGQRDILDKTVYYSGITDGSNLNGVAVMIDQSIKKAVKNFLPLSDRVMLLQLNLDIGTLNLIQVYAPTAEKEDEIIEKFYEDVSRVMEVTRHQDVTLIMGDLNAKMGQCQSNKWMGRFGLGERNERGDRLLQFCQENNMVITNTLFELPKKEAVYLEITTGLQRQNHSKSD
ncbi:hypothetical protein LSTR_LSTR002301 [Laodelphax striatellus]|uniref:Endonuclease/exonuclease/phosphatase domain-containing protein n=1 Tax=Laodelphax striatellus TaxID=195883 RepID=A0A482XGT1_LAOST|nr:hypothetical protein LSTR_LSTR002301 [Laodelphax striatellus]